MTVGTDDWKQCIIYRLLVYDNIAVGTDFSNINIESNE